MKFSKHSISTYKVSQSSLAASKNLWTVFLYRQVSCTNISGTMIDNPQKHSSFIYRHFLHKIQFFLPLRDSVITVLYCFKFVLHEYYYEGFKCVRNLIMNIMKALNEMRSSSFAFPVNLSLIEMTMNKILYVALALP